MVTQIRTVPASTSAPKSLDPTTLTREFVSGGGDSPSWLAMQKAARTLAHHIDDLTRDLGYDTYDKMMIDSQVSSGVSILKAAVLGDGVQIVAAVRDVALPGFEKAQIYHAFTQRTFDGMKTDGISFLWNMLDGVAYGHRIAEIIYEVAATGEDKGKLVIQRIKVKPRRSVAFAVDPYMNVVGLVARRPDAPWPPTVQDADDPNLLPRRKFVIYTHRPADSDPRGTSILRAAYTPWWSKIQMLPEYLKYLSQFAGGSLVGFTPPGATSVPVTEVDDEGDTVVISRITATEAMRDALVAFRNGYAAAFPNGSDVKLIEVSDNGETFLQAFGFFDTQIIKAILHQTLATEEGAHQARSAAEVHQDILSTLIRQAKQSVQTMIEDDLIKPLIELNFGPEAVALAPKASLGTIDQQDVSRIVGAMAALYGSGYIDPSQLSGIDRKLGLPERDPESIALAAEKRKKEAEAPVVAPAGPPGSTPSGPTPTRDRTEDSDA